LIRFLSGGESQQLDALGMLLDACHDALGKLQCGTSGDAIGGWVAASADGVNEGFKLGAERLDRRRREFLKSEFRLRAWAFDANAQGVTASVVERNIFVLLKETHLAHTLGGDAAGGYVGNRTTGKFQAGMSYVHLVGQDGNADGANFGDGLLHQSEKNIEIVDHYVENHVHVETARSEDAETMDLEEQRMIHNWLDREDCGIEAFDVADLQNA
jgi:hypothetical protein